MLFYETNLEENNINRKPLIFSQDMIITKFGQKKKWASLVLGKVYKNCLKIKKKILFYEINFEESNIKWKLLILSQDKIITKFEQKKWASLVLRKVFENCTKIKEKCYLTKLISNSVISTGNLLFGPKIG